MNEDFVIEYVEWFFEKYGREPTPEEISKGYADACDHAYELLCEYRKEDTWFHY